MGDLVKYEEYVTEVSETKQLRGGKLPARVYTIIIMEPDALSLDDIKKMKDAGKGPQAPPPKPLPSTSGIGEQGQIKKEDLKK